MDSGIGAVKTRMGAERQVQRSVRLKKSEKQRKRVFRERTQAHPFLLWCSASFLQNPTLIHLDLDLWLSAVWGEHFDLLKNSVLERWWGCRGFLAVSPCRLPTSKEIWGPAAIGSTSGLSVRSGRLCVILKILNWGENWISAWKVGFPLETLMSQSNSLLFTVGFPIWQLRFEIESSLKSEKKEHSGLYFRKCPNDEIWEMANVHDKGSGRSPKAWLIPNHVGDITGKSWGRRSLP